ncbi:MAG TPA: uroporphyrinogen-III synthase [Xanthobacteraceae bacterium]|nr:uroporphyrinogen-III synthase [Xanthobacteraceae bacterium]
MRLLLTRPEPDATRSAQVLRQRGHAVIVAPLTRLEPLAAEFAGPFAAGLITSANAARAAVACVRVDELRALPLFAVGARSAEVARAAGFADVTAADGALPDLVRLVATRVPPRSRLLYLAGEDRAGDLAADLARHGLAVETAVIYRAAASEVLPRAIAAAVDQLDGVLHYSRRSAALLLQLAERAGVRERMLRLAHYCLSEEVARPLREAGAARLHVAARPGEAALFDLI